MHSASQCWFILARGEWIKLISLYLVYYNIIFGVVSLDVALVDHDTMNKSAILKLSQSEIISDLGASLDGLSQKEAEKRLVEYGSNVLNKKTVSALDIFIRQLKSSLVYLLIIASLISYLIGDYTDATIIFVILTINTLLGFYQEYKSEKIVEKLSKFITKQVRIKRDGKNLLLDESQIVPGDIITVREGDIVPADSRLIETENLQVDESGLTGESVPVFKKFSNESNATADTLLFTGSIIEKGLGVGIVYATGKDTELGTIAKLSTETKKETQYEKALRTFSSDLVRIVLVGLVLVFLTKLIFNPTLFNAADSLLFVIALAVSTVPEVLPVITTVTLSSGALKLARKQVVVRKLSALEDLGNIDLLCTDKTGTITENKMTVHSIVSNNNDLFQKFAFATIAPLKGRKRRTQNSYDDAFLNYVPEHIQDKARHLTIIKEIPFDPNDRRRRIILEDFKDHKYYLVIVGAPEVLLKVAEFSQKTEYLHAISKEGRSGLHHLAIAYKEIKYTDDFDILKNESHLGFLGYVSLEDPLLPSARTAIAHAKKLGVKIKILTGDSKEVAEYAGKQIGLIDDSSRVYLGSELDVMTTEEFNRVVMESSVFAGVSPTQKFNIIKALKDKYVVGYQGDGINDAPALKLADVAIAVNTATDIAKDDADIVLLNKSLEVIVNGIRYGRSIFVNINKYVRYTMLNNFGMFISLSILYLSSTSLPILPIQILLTNLFGDVPLVTVSFDNVEEAEIIRPEKHNISELIFLSLILGIPTALFELLYFLSVRSQSTQLLQTSLYVFFAFQALVIFYAIRNKDHFWKAKLPPFLVNISFALAFIFSLAIIYVPKFQTLFSFVPLSFASVANIIALTILYFLVTDFVKVSYYL